MAKASASFNFGANAKKPKAAKGGKKSKGKPKGNPAQYYSAKANGSLHG